MASVRAWRRRVADSLSPAAVLGVESASPANWHGSDDANGHNCKVSPLETFPATARLKTSRDFSAVFDRCARKAGNRDFLVLTIPGGEQSRLGMVIAKKHVKLAVRRNGIKRVVREFFRTHPFDSPRDLVVLAKPGIINSNNAELKASLTALWTKLMVNTPKVDGAQ